MSKIKFLLIASLVLMTVACAKPPQADIDQARAALDAAEKAGAGKWASTEMAAARSALESANAEVDAQNGRFALVRKYDQAVTLLAEARSKAAAAEQAAVDNFNVARAEAEAKLIAAREAIARAGELTAALEACPKKPKGFAEDLAVMKEKVAAAETLVPDAETAFAAEDFDGVGARSQAILDQVTPLSADMESAQAKLGC